LLDRPSESTTKEISENAQSKLGLTEHEQNVLSEIREEKRLKEAPKGKRKKPQNPNPLSCKKKKKNDESKNDNTLTEENEGEEKKKKKRKKKVKVASHARESVAAKMKLLTAEA